MPRFDTTYWSSLASSTLIASKLAITDTFSRITSTTVDGAIDELSVALSATATGNVRRVVCTSGTRPVSPAEGVTIYETDTDLEYTWDNAAWVLTGGTAAWASYTPTLTQSASVAFTNTRAKWSRTPRRGIIGDFTLTVTGTGTAANQVTVTLPVPAVTTGTNTILGEGYVFDQSAGFYYYGVLMYATATTANFLRRAEGAAASYLGVTGFTAALAVNDVVAGSFRYEAAT